MGLSLMDLLTESINDLLTLGLGFLAAYLAFKAKNFATSEDFKKLLDQQKQTTQEVEAIRSNITHDVWLQQRRWELRRESYGVLLAELFQQQALDGIRLANLKTAQSGVMTAQEFSRLQVTQQQQLDTLLEHNRAIMSVLYMASPKAETVIHKYLKRILELSQIAATQDNLIEIVEAQQQSGVDAFAELLKVAREEFDDDFADQLIVTHQS
jgi:hypothetical protein